MSMNSTHLTEMEIDESKANEPTFVLFGCWKEQRNGTEYDRRNAFVLCGAGAWWVHHVGLLLERSGCVPQTRAKQEDGRRLGRFIRQPAAGSAAPAFFQVIPNGETRAREEHQPLQREQACRTTARNYFGDNLPVSILWGRFGRPLSRKAAGLRRSAQRPGPTARPFRHCEAMCRHLTHHNGSIASLTLPLFFFSFHHAPQNSTRIRSIWCRWG